MAVILTNHSDRVCLLRWDRLVFSQDRLWQPRRFLPSKAYVIIRPFIFSRLLRPCKSFIPFRANICTANESMTATSYLQRYDKKGKIIQSCCCCYGIFVHYRLFGRILALPFHPYQSIKLYHCRQLHEISQWLYPELYCKINSFGPDICLSISLVIGSGKECS